MRVARTGIPFAAGLVFLGTAFIGSDASCAAGAQETQRIRETKLPTPSDEMQSLARAYGVKKQYCCQMSNGCLSGPTDGSEVCRSLGGRPYGNSYCAPAEKSEKTPKQKKVALCVDP